MTMFEPYSIDAAEMSRDDRLPLVIAALADVFRDLHAGRAQSPPRISLRFGAPPGAEVMVSPAIWEQRGVAAVRVATFTPDNPRRGLPLIQGVVVLTDLDTGRITALLDGAESTALRTGAVAGLATRLCAPEDAGDLAVLGAGVQARALVRAVCAVRRIRCVRVCSRTRAGAEDFADWIRSRPDPPREVTVCDSPRLAVRDAEIICTATSTADRRPLIHAEWISPGAHLNIIGGVHEDALEVDAALLRTAFTVVEQRDVAMQDAGEVRAALARNLIGPEDLHELGAVLNGAVAPSGGTTVYRSVGLAIEDTATAAAMYEFACATQGA
ncbi:ornithine cyclodeaminase family protein [Nocardia sp. NPDC052566]|uniref:ornithine cyclodeaminase family protein n=1 Tax=Nocardia sp. NPDC052566 TaxID=3364330 RepID=UPI0037C58FA6